MAENTQTSEIRQDSKGHEVTPPPSSPSFDGEHLIGNQLRWAKQVLKYAFASKPEGKSHDIDTPVH